LDDWSENARLLVAIRQGPRAKRAALRSLFYPARGRRPAIFKVMVEGTRVPRFASTRALAIPARHGVPTRRSAALRVWPAWG
jgi:hypothetical protein